MPEDNNGETVLHVSATIATFILGIIITLIGAIYVNVTNSIAQVKASEDSQIQSLESNNSTVSLEVNKISTNVAIICVTVNAKCQ